MYSVIAQLVCRGEISKSFVSDRNNDIVITMFCSVEKTVSSVCFVAQNTEPVWVFCVHSNIFSLVCFDFNFRSLNVFNFTYMVSEVM